MNSEYILNANILDLLFEKRNKLYGAYNLRKFYNHRLLKSISITLLLVCFFCGFAMLPKKSPAIFSVEEVKLAILKVDPMQQKIKDIKKIVPKQQMKAAVASQQKILKPEIVANNLLTDTLQNLKTLDIIGSTTIIANSNNTNGLPTNASAKTTAGYSGTAIAEQKINDPNELVSHPDIEPSYPGGVNALRRFLERNLNNPTQMETGEMVAVNVSFVVGYDGKLQQFTIVKKGGELYDQEVLRVLKKMPQWIPGKANGKNVAVFFTIPVKFVPAD